MRWPIARFGPLLLLLPAALAGSLFGRRGGDARPAAAEGGEPAPVVEPAPPPPPEPAPEAPPLFPDGLPVDVDEVPPGISSLSAQSCAPCHAQAHEEWAGSAHARAGLAIADALDRVGDSPACRLCHLPLRRQLPWLAAGYRDGDPARPVLEPNPGWDPTLASEGVTCAACHVRGGVVLGTRPAPDAPHPVAVSEELRSPELCRTCHELAWPGADRPLYDTWGEWARSAWAEAGVGCADCHMPPRPGPALAGGFAARPSHAFAAPSGRGLAALVSVDGPELRRGEPFPVRLRLQNVGAGHMVPTGTPFALLRVRLALVGADGRPLAEPWTRDLGRTVEAAPPYATTADERVPPGGEVDLEATLTVPQRRPAGRGVLRLTVHRVGPEGRESEPLVRQDIPLRVL